MKKNLTITTVLFGNTVPRSWIPRFRGAVINCLKQDNVMFHNHIGDGLRYSYPLVQYKVLDGRAAIIGIEQGSAALQDYFSNYSSRVVLGGHPVDLFLDSVREETVEVAIVKEPVSYEMSGWIPLNEDNYKVYSAIESLVDKLSFLENILTGNILSFAKGVGLFFEDEVVCRISNMHRQHRLSYKGVGFIGLDISFKSNVMLPSGIGLGKGVSTGFGTIKSIERI